MSQVIDIVAHASALQKTWEDEFESHKVKSEDSYLTSLKAKWLGKEGLVTKLSEAMRSCPKEDKPASGKALNLLRKTIEAGFDDLLTAASENRINAILNRPAVDVTLPVSPEALGPGLHPVTLMRNYLLKIFRKMGFTVCDGPELDFDFYNFSALNIPADHPARDMQDTFYVNSDQDLVMRTQTSNMQIHTMLGEKPPLRMVSPGKTYRVDSDATHTPMFHQMECVVVDQGISFAHLKGLVETFLSEVFGGQVKTRFRSSFFPFVEPGAEVDMQCSLCSGRGCKVCKNTGWLEIGGCGMIHPNVFEAVGVDSEIYTGFAFGFGLDRMAMMAWNITDLRMMFEGNYEFQSQFPLHQ